MSSQKVKVALVISGAVSLGSFESGVVAELLRAAQRKDSPIKIDVIGGASAGAITGATLAYYLTRQTGPHRDYPEQDYPALAAWKEIDVDLLTKYDPAADRGLLSRSVLLAQTDEILKSETERMPELDSNDVLLFMTLTSLHGKEIHVTNDKAGLAVDIAYRSHSEQVFFRIPALNEAGAQWGEERVARDAPVGEAGKDIQSEAPASGDKRLWYKIFNYALTSAANAGAWPARRHYKFDNRPDIWWPYGASLDQQVEERRRRFGRTDGYLYFTDGGTVDNRPILKMLQHALGLRVKLDREPDLSFDQQPSQQEFRDELGTMATPMDLDRMLLFVEPDPAEKDHSEDSDSRLNDPDAYEGFLAGSLRAFQTMQRSAPDYVDLNWVSQVNRQMVAALHDTALMAEALRTGNVLEQLFELAAPAGHAPVPVPAAVSEFFAWLAQEKNPLPDAKLNFVVKTRNGKEWRPLDSLAAELVDLRERYLLLTESGRQQVRSYFADYLKRHDIHTKRWICVDRIAPLETQRQPLARGLMHFGGFIKKEWMAYDYLLGQQVALRWMLDTYDPQVEEWAGWRTDAAMREHDLRRQLDRLEQDGIRAEADKPVDLLLANPVPLRAMLAQSCKVAGEYLERSGSGVMGRVLWFITRVAGAGLQGKLWRTIGRVLLGGLALWLVGVAAMLARPFSEAIAAWLGYLLLGLGYLLLGMVGAAVLLVAFALVYVLRSTRPKRKARRTDAAA